MNPRPHTSAPRRAPRRTAIVGAAALIPLIALAACGGDDDSSASTSDSTADGSATVEIESPFGTVTMPAEPEAALGMYPTDLDVLMTLDYPLAASQPVRDAEAGLPAYLTEAGIDEVEVFSNFPEFNFEAIAAAQPDFILNSLGYDESTVDVLPGIAPTYSYNGFEGTPWLPRFEALAVDLGRVEQYEAWAETYDGKVEELREALGDRPNGMVVAPLSYYEGTLTASCGGSYAICGVLEDLGFTVFEPAAVPSGEVGQNPGTDYSLENVDDLADVDAVVTTFTGPEATSLDELQGTAVWDALGFVAEDQVFGYDLEASMGSPNGVLFLLDQISAAFAG